MTPEALSTDIVKLYDQLQGIPEFEDEFCHRAFPGFLKKAQHLLGFKQVQSYRVVFIGEPGKGKTTAICNWLNLLWANKTSAERIDKVSLLATASGRTTVAEVHIRQVSGNSRLRLEYMPIEMQEAYIRDYTDYYYRKCKDITEDSEEADSVKNDVHIEIDRVVRHMAKLQDIPSGKSDRTKIARDKLTAFIADFEDSDSFYDYVLDKIDLNNRQCTEIEKPSNIGFNAWLSDTFRQVNDGKRPDCSIADVIHVDVSVDDLDLMLPEYISEVIDTKGLDSAAAARMDLQRLMRAEDTVCFVMDDVKSVPSDNVRNLLKRTFLTGLDTYYMCKTSIFVKSPESELANVNGADGDSEAGIDLKASEIDRRVATDGIPYFPDNTVFLDSCAAYMMKTVKRRKVDNAGHQIIDPRTNRPQFINDVVISDYDEDIAYYYRDDLTKQVASLIGQLNSRLELDTLEIRDGVAKLLEIERTTTGAMAMEELREAKRVIEDSRGSLLRRFHQAEVNEAILHLTIDSIAWQTIRKMNKLYGAYERWHTDIYTQIMQAGRECFADLIRPMSDFVHQTLISVEHKEARSLVLGYLNQYDLMVKESTDMIGTYFLNWALKEEFRPQNDQNPFWNHVNQLRGRGYKRMVRDAYEAKIKRDTAKLANAVNSEANKIVDDLLDHLSEDTARNQAKRPIRTDKYRL